MFNVQLNYNYNKALDPESWDGSFCVVSLHRLMEHLASDVQNIKESLTRMWRYILDKSIENDKANKVKDLEGIGKANEPGCSTMQELLEMGHTDGIYHIQGAKYVKYNGPHLTAHHHHFAWCCKANDKTNPPRLETKKGEFYSHTFKCLNCKGDHQADSNEYSFWKHHFNKEWHTKEYSKLWETRKNLTCSVVNVMGQSP